MTFPGGTLDQYDEITDKMGFAPGGPGSPGGLFHWVAATDDGLRIVDVWQDRETYQRFVDEQLGPRVREAGAPAPTDVHIYEVHNYLTAG
ncbi:hypothetical protein [Actinocatenispora rupis]|uniref:Antibiotic biosynthesis monooxygenase n=1 Tax=Actinocatenispora rupis TaxID=519421 RepID=A0A8J3NCB0_9ACTN|nr:hypothetical protein [Actinocatenispora rupis]GID11557.1 hypothetical protein Aru02nite_24460 [Actinocatenispora rupis]